MAQELLPSAVPFHVLGMRGCGSTLVEAALLLAGIAYERDEVDYTSEQGLLRLKRVNPLGQVPAVITPDGKVLTESAAVILHLAELAPGADLAPLPTDPQRAEFLRWLMFMVAAIYPTFTYGDEPQRWVGEHGPRLRASTDAHREQLWRKVEGAAGEPWFLGAHFSAIDLYVAVMTHWRPGRAWFARHCPKLHASAVRLDQHPRLRELWAYNFPPSSDDT